VRHQHLPAPLRRDADHAVAHRDFGSDAAGVAVVRDDEQALEVVVGWGWHNEAGIHVLRLILSGAFEKFPDLQVISGHWGEMAPFYLERLDDVIPPEATGLSGTISDIYRRHVWVTPSGMFGLPHFEFMHQVIGADRIIWSVDYPFLTLDGTPEFIEKLPVSQDDKEKIAYPNAEKLFSV
jgi:predicted TIM-barrel fold metal-dependent hydrolase